MATDTSTAPPDTVENTTLAEHTEVTETEYNDRSFGVAAPLVSPTVTEPRSSSERESANDTDGQQTTPATVLDPFKLLGASINSTVADVKKAYRTLMRSAHPDKAGSSYDLDQLQYLQDAYEYVLEQIEATNHTVTVDDLERDFAQYCTQDKEARNIDPADLKDFLRDFNAEFNDLHDKDVSKAGIDCGYGDFMADSEYRDRSAEVSPPVYKQDVPVQVETTLQEDGCGDASLLVKPFPASVVEWHAPWARSSSAGSQCLQIGLASPMLTYGVDGDFSDYQEAYPDNGPLPDVTKPEPKEAPIVGDRELIELIEQRKIFVDNLKQQKVKQAKRFVPAYKQTADQVLMIDAS